DGVNRPETDPVILPLPVVALALIAEQPRLGRSSRLAGRSIDDRLGDLQIKPLAVAVASRLRPALNSLLGQLHPAISSRPYSRYGHGFLVDDSRQCRPSPGRFQGLSACKHESY